MDQNARKKQLLKFAQKQAQVLFVTDLAARGLDIPALDVVINYDFPEKPKVFTDYAYFGFSFLVICASSW